MLGAFFVPCLFAGAGSALQAGGMRDVRIIRALTGALWPLALATIALRVRGTIGESWDVALVLVVGTVCTMTLLCLLPLVMNKLLLDVFQVGMRISKEQEEAHMQQMQALMVSRPTPLTVWNRRDAA
jgi:hypothetical protein